MSEWVVFVFLEQPFKTIKYGVFMFSGARCSSMVQRLLMVQWSISHGEPIELFCILTGMYYSVCGMVHIGGVINKSVA